MKEDGKIYVDTSKVSIREINKSVAKEMIVKYHYSHAWTMCRYAFSLYYEDESSFYGEEKLIGCMVLTRLFIHDGYGSNIESFAMSQSFKWMKQHAPNIKMLLSYADPEQLHLGGIYQATNWLYQDCRDIQLMPNYSISLENPHKWIHSRTVFSKWGSHNLDHLKKELGKQGYSEFWRKREAPKHRYIQILGQNKSEKKKLSKMIKHKISPYPKNAEEFLSPIENHKTLKVESNKFFDI